MTDTAPEQVDAALDSMLDTLHQFLAFRDQHQPTALVLFAAASHAVVDLMVCPYVRITAPTEACGKSTAGVITGQFMHGRPQPLLKATPAGIRRALTAVPYASLILDELDLIDPSSEFGSELFSVINGGYTRVGSESLRADGKTKGDTISESSFGFKVLIGNDDKRLKATTLSRCITITMQRALPGEVLQQWEPTTPQWQQVKQSADAIHEVMGNLKWAWLPQGAIDQPATVSLYPESIDGFSNRDRQLWRPLLAVAEYAGPMWQARALEAAKALGADHESAMPRVLLDITTLLHLPEMQSSVFGTTEGSAIPTGDLVRGLLNLIEDSVWKADPGRGRKALTGKRLAELLRGFDVKPKLRAVQGDAKANHRSYLVSELAEAGSRYGAVTPYLVDSSDVSVRTLTQQGFPADSEVLDTTPVYHLPGTQEPSDGKGSNSSDASNRQVGGQRPESDQSGTADDLPDPY